MKTGQTFLAGLITGALLVIFVLLLRRTFESAFWVGVAYGFGIGLGIILGMTALNWLVGQLDRIKG